MGGCASSDESYGACAGQEDGYMREQGYMNVNEGKEIKIYVNAKGTNTMVVVNTIWTVSRLKRELRFLDATGEWQWCSVHNLADDRELVEQMTLLSLGIHDHSILRLVIHDLPQSAEGVISMLKSGESSTEERVAGLLEVGHQVLQSQDPLEEATIWWDAGFYNVLVKELLTGESTSSKAIVITLEPVASINTRIADKNI